MIIWYNFFSSVFVNLYFWSQILTSFCKIWRKKSENFKILCNTELLFTYFFQPKRVFKILYEMSILMRKNLFFVDNTCLCPISPMGTFWPFWVPILSRKSPFLKNWSRITYRRLLPQPHHPDPVLPREFTGVLASLGVYNSQFVQCYYSRMKQ